MRKIVLIHLLILLLCNNLVFAFKKSSQLKVGYNSSEKFDDTLNISTFKLTPPFKDTINLKFSKLLTENSLVISNFDLLRKAPLNWINIFPLNTNSFIFDLGLPSNFYELVLRQSGLRRVSFQIDEIELNDGLTEIYDLRDLRIDAIDSIIIISPLRAFLTSRNNHDESIRFVEKRKSSPTPYSRIKYLESPYDNLLFDGNFNVNFHKNWNFDFGITKHNASYRFLNSEKDLWAGKLELSHDFSKQLNFNLTYLYSKSHSRFNEGIDIYNALVPQNQPIESYLYDERKAIPVNNDAYHKWTFNSLKFETQFSPSYAFASLINIYYLNNLREFRDNEYKADSLKILENHQTKSIGIKANQLFKFLFNKFELNVNVENLKIESPYTFGNINRNLSSFYFIYTLNLSEYLIPTVFYKVKNNNINVNKYSNSFGIDIQSNIAKNFSLYGGYSKIKSEFSVDEVYFNNFNLNDTQYDVDVLYSKLNIVIKQFELTTEIYNKLRKFPINSTSFYSEEQNNSIINFFPEEQNLLGGSFALKFSIWRVKTNLNFSFNEQKVKVNQTYYRKISLPRYLVQLSTAYHGTHFENNLDLIAGFRLNLFSSFYTKSFSPSKLYFIDIRSYVNTTLNFGAITIPSNFTIDLFATGRIKENAIVYLALENIMDKKYFLIPYYPANDIQFKFGIVWELEN